jgi:hypothetical protein
MLAEMLPSKLANLRVGEGELTEYREFAMIHPANAISKYAPDTGEICSSLSVVQRLMPL